MRQLRYCVSLVLRLVIQPYPPVAILVHNQCTRHKFLVISPTFLISAVTVPTIKLWLEQQNLRFPLSLSLHSATLRQGHCGAFCDRQKSVLCLFMLWKLSAPHITCKEYMVHLCSSDDFPFFLTVFFCDVLSFKLHNLSVPVWYNWAAAFPALLGHSIPLSGSWNNDERIKSHEILGLHTWGERGEATVLYIVA